MKKKYPKGQNSDKSGNRKNESSSGKLKLDYSGLFLSGLFNKQNFEKLLKENQSILKDFLDEDKPFYNILKNTSLSKIKHLINGKNFSSLVVIGMGGSSLGARALCRIQKNKNRRVVFLDNTDPETAQNIISKLNPKETLVNVVTKSGTTTETLTNFFIIHNWLKKNSPLSPSDQIIATTGRNAKELRSFAYKRGISVFDIPEDVEGRYSVLTPVGLVPACFAGCDIKKLIKGALDMSDRCHSENYSENPAYIAAWSLVHLAQCHGYTIDVLMPYIDSMRGFALWFRQLWAESLGKNSRGMTPAVARGATDQHSQLQLYTEGPRDKVITFLESESFHTNMKVNNVPEEMDSSKHLKGKSLEDILTIQKKSTEYSLHQVGCPTMTLLFPEITSYTVGQFIYLMECQTVIAGRLLRVTPYTQPGVEESKTMTSELLRKEESGEKREKIESHFNQINAEV